MKLYAKLSIGLALLGALAGCGGGGGAGGGIGGGGDAKNVVSLNGSVIKGRVANAAVVAWGLDASGKKGAQPLAQTTTLSNGTFELPKFSLFSSSVLVETAGGTYKDEATGNTVANPGLKALIPRAAGTMNVTVTPLTHLAFACISSTGLTRSGIDGANALVSTAFGINIPMVVPADVTDAAALSHGATYEVEYGLLLAAVSKIGVSQFITAVRTDLTTQHKFSQTTADLINKAISDLLSSGVLDKNNGAIIAAQAGLAQTIKNNTTATIPDPPDPGPNPAKAKAFVADLRNTMLAFYNYSSGPFNPKQLSPTLQSPYNAISSEIQNKIQPEIVAILDAVGWVMDTKLKAGTTVIADKGSVTITDTFTEAGGATLSTRTAVVKNPSGQVVATLTFKGDSLSAPTAGYLVAEIVTNLGTTELEAEVVKYYLPSTLSGSGNFRVSLSGSFYTVDSSGNTVMNGIVGLPWEPASATYTTICAPPFPTYLDSVAFSGQVCTSTVNIAVDLLSIPALVTNRNLNAPLPSGFVTLAGTIKTLDSTGLTLKGTMLGQLTNAATITKDGLTKPSARDFPQWNASFAGSMSANNGLNINAAAITAATDTYQETKLSMQLQRTRPDGTKFNFNASGTYYAEHNTIELAITNQDGLALTCNTARDGSFSGGMMVGGTTSLARIYMLMNVPFIKYSDDYVESLF